MGRTGSRQDQRVPLENPASIVVVGGGPAGCFFAIEALRQARLQRRELEITIIEQKSESASRGASGSAACREGCNYCAGGISPQLADVLDESGLTIPSHVIQSRITSVTLQGNWKHIELKVPAGRKMFSVYRGSRPCLRSHRKDNFDSYLLECALRHGAQVITGRAYKIEYSQCGKPVVHYGLSQSGQEHDLKMEADFLVIAGGVNQMAGMSLKTSTLVDSLHHLIPQFEPPRVRKTLICELKINRRISDDQKGEIYFVEYGSKDLSVEMSSLIPKEDGLITLVMLGPSVDNADDGDKIDLAYRFLRLPHIRRLMPPKTKLDVVCACFPNMTVGKASDAYGDRIAAIGDMAVARLYKDGILSAHTSARALARCVLEEGVDCESLRRGFWPTIESLEKDNQYGKVVFLMNRLASSHPLLSRVLYQAALTERKSKKEDDRYLQKLLWKIASGDDTYRNIFRSMVTARALNAIFVGGLLVTARNYLTEVLFDLRWGDIGRFPTGVYREVMEAKRRDYADRVPDIDWERRLDFESMYSIRIDGSRKAVLSQLAKFGEHDMEYFRPRIVRIRKTCGGGNEPGKEIRYHTPFKSLTFSIALEAVLEERYIIYRVRSGFAKGGALIFDVEDQGRGQSTLSIYVAFNFARGETILSRCGSRIFKMLFPHYVHDVLWNYALCQLKGVAESRET